MDHELDLAALHEQVLSWYDTHARVLPWRDRTAGAWSVLVSEVMLQQTPVSRVLPVHEQWLATWPTPAALAVASPGDAVRAWGRLGYPRRALRLHAAAVTIAKDHDGIVPQDLPSLRALPGVGEYTAAAVASFAYGQRHVVLDTNVRRVIARAVTGVQFPNRSLSVGERALAASLLPADDADRWAVAVMELGAICCTAAAPRCGECPLAGQCRWRALGHPAHDGPARRTQAWEGTDRQCRGRLLAVLRDADGAVPTSTLAAVWEDDQQRARALDGLVADGLVEPLPDASYSLPR